jgi:predicted phage terminase large subunit-like protein
MIDMHHALPTPTMIDAERARRHLRVYIEQAWPVLEPGTPFVPGFHIDAIADHLEAITHGHLQRLLINIPPRHMKSLAVAVFWPTWEWLHAPHRRWLFASYAQALSIRDSLKCRRLIDSPWYRARWGHVYQLTSDQNLKQRFENNRTGYRIATSVGGMVTGEGGDRIVVDDPHNVRDAPSDAVRTRTLQWWDQAMSTRLNDPRTGAFVIVMQRVHQQDLAGHVLEQGGYEHLCLPAEFDGRKTVTLCGWTDPRTEAGELLWPERFTRVDLDALKRQLGSYGASGQLQQQPVPAGGGMFKRAWFHLVDAMPVDIHSRCRFWDCAATVGGGDWTVGVKVARTRAGQYVVEHVVRGRWSPAEVQQIIRQTAEQDGKLVRIREEQEPGSAGKTVVADRTKLLAGFDYKGVPSTGEKTTRWRPFAAQAEAGNVAILKGLWNADWLDEISAAPFAAHDDQVDAASGAFSEVALNTPPTVRTIPLVGW